MLTSEYDLRVTICFEYRLSWYATITLSNVNFSVSFNNLWMTSPSRRLSQFSHVWTHPHGPHKIHIFGPIALDRWQGCQKCHHSVEFWQFSSPLQCNFNRAMTLSGLHKSTGGIYNFAFNIIFRVVSLKQAREMDIWYVASFFASFLISTNRPTFSLKSWKASPPSGPKIQPAWYYRCYHIFHINQTV